MGKFCNLCLRWSRFSNWPTFNQPCQHCNDAGAKPDIVRLVVRRGRWTIQEKGEPKHD